MSDFDEQIESLRKELLLAQSQRLEPAKFKLVSLATTVIGIAHLVLTPNMWLLGVAEVLSGILGVAGAVILSRQTSARIARLASARDRL